MTLSAVARPSAPGRRCRLATKWRLSQAMSSLMSSAHTRHIRRAYHAVSLSPPLPTASRTLSIAARSISSTASRDASLPARLLHARVQWYQKQISSGQLATRELPLLLSTMGNKEQGWQVLCAALLSLADARAGDAILQSAARLSPRNKLLALSCLIDTIPARDASTLRPILDVLSQDAVPASEMTQRPVADTLFHVLAFRAPRGTAEAAQSPLTPVHVNHIVRSVLQLPSQTLTASVNAAGESLDHCAISMAEHYLPTPELVRLYEDCGLPFEAAGYRSHGRTVEAPPRVPCGKGFGDAVSAALSRRPSSTSVSLALLSRMPSQLAEFTRDLLALSTARWQREQIQTGADVDDASAVCSHLNASQDPQNARKRLEQTSDVHFRYLCGTASTARVLLAHCTTRSQVATVMAHTSSAGTGLAFEAAKKMIALRPSDTLFVSLRIAPKQPRGRRRRGDSPAHPPRFVFEAKAEPFLAHTTESTVRSRDTVTGLLHDRTATTTATASTTTTATRDALAMDVLSRALHSTGLFPLQKPFRQSIRSSEETLGSIGEGNIAGLLANVPQLRASQVSLWGSLLIRRGNLSAARTLFVTAAQRHLAPDLETVVEYLEAHHRADPVSVQDATRFIRSEFPAMAPNAFRAFMERLSSSHSRAGSGQLEPGTALHLLLYATDNDLRHWPPGCLEAVASGTRGDDIRVLLDVLSSSSHATTQSHEVRRAPPPRVPPLCLTAIRRLAETVAEDGCALSADFFSLSRSSLDVLWWSSQDVATGKTATQRLYETGTCALWGLAARELGWGLLQQPIHASKALRLVCLGCDDATRVVATLDTGLNWVADRQHSPTRSAHGGEAALLAPTLLCAAEALCAMNEPRTALRLLPADSDTAPAAIRLARQRAVGCIASGARDRIVLKRPRDNRLLRRRFTRARLHSHLGQSRGLRARRCPPVTDAAALTALGLSRPLQKLVASSPYANSFLR